MIPAPTRPTGVFVSATIWPSFSACAIAGGGEIRMS